MHCIVRSTLFTLMLVSCAVAQQDQKAVFQRGTAALAEHHYDVARDAFEQLLRSGLRTASVFSNLGISYLHTDCFEQAVDAFTKAKRLAPDATAIDLNLGIAHYRNRDFDLAVPYLAAVLAQDPVNLRARYLKGMCHFMTDQYRAAIEDLAALPNQQEEDLDLLFVLGISYGKLNRTEDSERAFQRLAEAGRDTPHLHLLLAKAHIALRDQGKARQELAKTISVDSRFPLVHYYLGILEARSGHLEEAKTQFTEEIRNRPGEPWAYEELSHLLFEQGSTAAAVSLLEKAVAENPAHPKLLAALAKAYLERSEAEKAIPYLLRGLKFEPGDGTLHYQLARAYLKTGHRTEASRELSLARALMARSDRRQIEEFSAAAAGASSTTAQNADSENLLR